MIIMKMILDCITAEEPHGELMSVYNCSIHVRKISSLMKLEMSTLAELAAPSSATEVGCPVKYGAFHGQGCLLAGSVEQPFNQLHLVISSSEI